MLKVVLFDMKYDIYYDATVKPFLQQFIL